MSRRARVLLVDDHALFREGLAGLIAGQPDFEVAGEAEDGLEALVKAQELRPDLILMDVTMPGGGGLEATRLIKEALPDAKIVMLTVHDDDERLFDAVRCGAVGYVLKSTTSAALISMLRGAMRGEAAISGATAARILEQFGRLTRRELRLPPAEEAAELTPREREVLEQVVAGAADKEIAAELSISLSTVKTHMRSVLAKLHTTGRHQAAARALREGLVRPPGDQM